MDESFEQDLDALSKLPFKKLKQQKKPEKHHPLLIKLEEIDKRLSTIEKDLKSVSILVKNESLKNHLSRKSDNGNHSK